MDQTASAVRTALTAPRSIGSMMLTTKRVTNRTGVDRFRTSGATKVAFPRSAGALEAIMINTSGGLTGGDRFDTTATAGPGTCLTLTTQAAERAYRSQSGAARIATRLRVEADATLRWLPQELIVFDRAHIDRRMEIDIEEGGELVLVEPVVFGRRAMGEKTICGTFRDRITLRRGGKPIYWDHINLTGPISTRLARPAIAFGLTALASVLYVGARAEALLPLVRLVLPRTGGASLVAPDLLTLRLLALDSFDLRQSLVPVLKCLTGTTLPKSWSL